MKRNFEQWSELQVAKCLVVHVMSSSNNVSSFGLRNKKKTTQEWSLRVANDIVLNQVSVYHERVYADNFVSKFWFVRSFSSQLHSEFIANIATGNVSQDRNKECKARSFIFNFLPFSRHFHSDTASAVIVCFLNEIVYGFNNISNGSVKTRFQIIEFRRL